MRTWPTPPQVVQVCFLTVPGATSVAGFAFPQRGNLDFAVDAADGFFQVQIQGKRRSEPRWRVGRRRPPAAENIAEDIAENIADIAMETTRTAGTAGSGVLTPSCPNWS